MKHITKGISSLAVLLLFCFALVLPLQSQEWKEKYNKNGLEILVRGAKTNEYKATMMVDADLNACIALMQDIDVHPTFMGAVKHAEVVKVYNEKESMIKCILDMPFGMSDQEIVSSANFVKIPNKNSVQINIAAKPNALPKTKLKRLTLADGYWLFEQIGELKTKVTYQLKFEESSAPNWIVNYFVVDGPIKTMSGFSKLVKLAKYSKTKVSWL